jgi:hypothetical protein
MTLDAQRPPDWASGERMEIKKQYDDDTFDLTGPARNFKCGRTPSRAFPNFFQLHVRAMGQPGAQSCLAVSGEGPA